ncbi:hypothetical protein B0H14DRAFT_3551069 [Mycena olivaceomarginata]|nr:hypothetical protein B0H14DRAFT_3551069 [Mycena olivaceomarginata]
MSLVKNSDDLLVAAAKQCQLDDGTLPKGSDLGDAASFRLDSGFVQARGSTENIATAVHPKCKEDVEAQAAVDEEEEEWQQRLCSAPPPSPRPRAKQRLLELENEHRLEDTEALKFTDEQRISLFLSFRSVKLEWSDLDGVRSVRWCCNSSRPASPPLSTARSPYLHLQTQLHTDTRDPIHPPALPLSLRANVHSYSYPAPAAPPHFYSSPPPAASEAFAFLTNAHLVSFGKDDTICVRQPSYSSPTPTHSTHAVAFPVSPHRYASASAPMPTSTSPRRSPRRRRLGIVMPPMVWSVSSLPAPVRTSPTSGGKPRSSAREKRRSPVKVLFSFSLSSASSASAMQMTTPCPIRVLLPPLVSVDGDAPEEGDEDVWVDADDDDNNDNEGGDDGHGRPGPCGRWRRRAADACTVALRAARAPYAVYALSVNVHVCAPPATPAPYSEAGRERERKGEQVDGKRKR